MRGIFSSRIDQRAAIVDFVREAARDKKTIEWGPIDITIDAAARIRGRQGITVPSGTSWVMHPETRIRALPNAATHYTILDITDVENIKIAGNGARIIGDRYAHGSSEGEWGFGVSLRGARNVYLRDLVVEDCWGDSFYIGSGKLKYCQDIVLENTKSFRARRNGLSLISARGFASRCHESFDTGGTAPQAGIDIEPNHPLEYLEDITFENASTIRSNGIGLGVYLNALEKTPNPISITLSDCSDEASLIGFSVSAAKQIAGSIKFIRPTSKNAMEAGISLRGKSLSGPLVTLQKPKIMDWNQGNAKSAAASSALCIFAAKKDGGDEQLGKVDIINPHISITSGRLKPTAAIFARDHRRKVSKEVTDIRIIDPSDLAQLRVFLAAERAQFYDTFGVSRRVLRSTNFVLKTSNIFCHNFIDVDGLGNYQIGLGHPVGIVLRFELINEKSAASIALLGNETFDFTDGTAGSSLTSAELGAAVALVKIRDQKWQIIEMVKDWHVE